MDTSWFTGDKKSYDISTAEQLAGFAQIVRAVDGKGGDRFIGITINLTRDIVLNDTSNWRDWETTPPRNAWTPIGVIGSPGLGYRPFAGCFNGNGHTISGMYVNSGSYCGLFTYTSSAVVKDLKIEKSVILGNEDGGSASSAGTAAGSLAGVAEATYFDQCIAENVIVSGKQDVGGLVGRVAQINHLVSFMQFVMMGFNVNPLVLGLVRDEKIAGTYFSGCTVAGAELKTARQWDKNYPAGGIVGQFCDGMAGALLNCSTSVIAASSIKYSGIRTGACGGVYGSIDESLVRVEGCSTTGFARTDPGTVRSDAGKVPEISAEKKDLASRLPSLGWVEAGARSYWYEGGVRQGTTADAKGVRGDGTVRGREIYDQDSNGWYWLDACNDGLKACSKEVWMPYIYQEEKSWNTSKIAANAKSSGDMAGQVEKAIRERTGKWVRYDANGKMYKGWYTVGKADARLYPDQVGNTYYYDPKTGLMAKGYVTIEGVRYHFDEVTGALD